MLYTEKVMDHFEHPRNVGEIENADGVGQVGNPKCGDIMKMYLKIDDGVITDVKFKTFGCGSAIATSSMATELIKGKPIEEAMTLTNAAVAEALDGLPAYKMHWPTTTGGRAGRCRNPSDCPVRTESTAPAVPATECCGLFSLTGATSCHRMNYA